MIRARGFTLIELLMVVLVLAMLAGVLVPIMDESSQRSRSARRKSDLKNLAWALEAYRMANGTYPTTGGAWQGDAPAFGGRGYDQNGYIPGLVPRYIQALPRDPDPRYPSADFGYAYRSDGLNYKVLANKTPEEYPPTNRFQDPKRPKSAWQVSSPGGYNW